MGHGKDGTCSTASTGHSNSPHVHRFSVLGQGSAGEGCPEYFDVTRLDSLSMHVLADESLTASETMTGADTLLKSSKIVRH